MLDGDAVVPRRPRPAERALVLAGPSPRLARARSSPRAPSRSSSRRPRRAPAAGRAARSAGSAGPLRRRRTDSAAGSSTCRPRAHPPPRSRVAVRPAEAPRAVRLHVDLRCPSVTSSASALPSPPAPPKPFSDSPAASQKPRTLESTPSSGLPSGVIASGWQTSAVTPAFVEEREAPHRAVHQLREALVVGREHPRAVLPGHAVLPARNRVRLVAAEHHATALGFPVDEIVGVAKARHVARRARALRLRGARCAGGRRGSSRRTSRPSPRSAAPTSPPRSRPCRLRSAPCSVSTAATERSRVSIPVTRVCVRISTPSSRAADAKCVRRNVRVDVAVARHPDRAVKRHPATPPASAGRPPRRRRAPHRGRCRARG